MFVLSTTLKGFYQNNFKNMAEYIPNLNQKQNIDSMLPQAVYAAAITPSDSADIANIGDGGVVVYVGVGGDLVVDTLGGQTAVTFKNMGSGQILPVVVKRVRSTNTTATNLVAIK